MSETLHDLRAERDLYRSLLELGGASALEPFLRDALRAVTALAGARKGFVELTEPLTGKRWALAHGAEETEVAAFRATLSSGVISAALERRETISTIALHDPRFRANQSVRREAIEAVLAVPVGKTPALGVLYLQGRDARGEFPPEDIARAELFARHLAPIAARLLDRHALADADDPTHPWRQMLDLAGVVGRSRALAEVLRVVAIASPARVPVLLTGPSGTGKTQLARAIHANSGRKGLFLELNCGAIAEGLVESELFGAMPGAFTGATGRLVGKVEAASGGTLFLDEVGELPPAVQVKLLTFLESGTYFPVGSAKPHQADLRVLAATNRDLAAAIGEGRFREDLFHRLTVVHIAVPSLASRPEDVVPLALHLLERGAAYNRVGPLRLGPAARLELQSRDWPGNIRELSNSLEWALLQALAEGAEEIEPRHLGRVAPPARAPATAASAAPDDWHEATRWFQRQLLSRVLEEEGWNRSAAARRLGIARSYLYETIESLGIVKP